MEQFWKDILEFARTTTEEVGIHLSEFFGQVQATRKADGTLVTKADKWADEAIRNAIAQRFPDHGVLTEETQHILPDNDWCWVVDPVDGTTNFTRGIPIWGISLGLLYQGTPVFGFVHFPLIGQTFHGYWYGDTELTGPTGAFLNDEPIKSSIDSPSHNHLFNVCARSTAVLKNEFPCKVRMVGVASYSCVLVASGAALGTIEATPKIWDIAAAWAITQAAGAVFVHLEPHPVFPLKVGEDYMSRSFPCLVVSQPELVSVFKPLVEFIGERVLSQ